MDFFGPDFSGEQKREIESLVAQLESGMPEIGLCLALDLQGRVIASSRLKDDEVEILSRWAFIFFAQVLSLSRGFKAFSIDSNSFVGG